jgi:DNA (cytosine-5)-methyltransferase 1
MKHIGLFEGIGGFSLAACWMGWETVAWCEWNEFGQKVLKHHFPKAEGFGDITKTDFTKYANTVDIVTGGFPCQPYSVAGKRKGKDDERHLWPEMLRAIREIKPRWVVGENVLGLVNWNGGLVFDEVQTDLEAEGYEVQPFILPACAKNAPHRRDRVWFVAFKNIDTTNTKSNRARGLRYQNEKKGAHIGNELFGKRDRIYGSARFTTNTSIFRGGENEWLGNREPKFINKNGKANDWRNFPTQPPICRGDDGISEKLDTITFPKWRKESIKAYGNAIVPQVAFEIFKAIQAYENLST